MKMYYLYKFLIIIILIFFVTLSMPLSGGIINFMNKYSYASAGEHLTLDEITITDTFLDMPGHGKVLGKKIVEKGKNFNISDILANEPEIDLKRNARIGDTGDMIALRGLSRNRLLLTIDGRPVTASGIVGGYYIDWSTIALDSIKKVEIIKGGSSVLYGNNAIGGVINIISSKPSAKPATNLFTSYSTGKDISYIKNMRFSHSNKQDNLGYRLSFSEQKASEFLWNNGFTGKNASIALYLDAPGNSEISANIQYSQTKRGFIINNRASDDPSNPLFYNKINESSPLSLGESMSGSGMKNAGKPGPGSNWDKEKYLYDITYKKTLDKDSILELKFYKNYEDRKEKNYSIAGIYSGVNYESGRLILDRVIESDRSWGTQAQIIKNMGTHEITAGIEKKIIANGDIRVNYVDNTYNGGVYTGTTPNNKGNNINFYVQDAFKLNEKFFVTAGIRNYTYKISALNPGTHELSGSGTVPKVTATFKINSKETLTAALYQAERTPGLPEIYWSQNAVRVNNNVRNAVTLPDLNTEKNTAFEVSYEKKIEKGYLKLSAYQYKIKDYIMSRFEPNWQGIYNIDNVNINGITFEASRKLSKLTGLNFNVTYQKSGKNGDTFDYSNIISGLDSMPKFKSNLSLDFNLNDRKNSVITANIKYVGNQDQIYTYEKNINKLIEISAYSLLDLSYKTRAGKNSEFEIFIENVFDKKYEEKFGYPISGRMSGISYKINF